MSICSSQPRTRPTQAGEAASLQCKVCSAICSLNELQGTSHPAPLEGGQDQDIFTASQNLAPLSQCPQTLSPHAWQGCLGQGLCLLAGRSSSLSAASLAHTGPLSLCPVIFCHNMLSALRQNLILLCIKHIHLNSDPNPYSPKPEGGLKRRLPHHLSHQVSIFWQQYWGCSLISALLRTSCILLRDATTGRSTCRSRARKQS